MELLISSWPFQNRRTRKSSAGLILNLMINGNHANPDNQWMIRAVAKTITDKDSAIRITRPLCRDIRRKEWIVDTYRLSYCSFLEALVEYSSLVREVGIEDPKENILRSAAISCQRQLCLGSPTESTPDIEFAGISKPFSLAVYAHLST